MAKSLDEFHRHPSARDGRQSYCKPCSTINRRKYGVDRRDELAAKARAYRARNREKMRRTEAARYANSPAIRLTLSARSNPCADCGITLPPQVMELDHVRGEKKFTLGGPRISRRPEVEVREEIAKCETRCPNCHKLRHHWEREAIKAERGY